MKRTKKVLGAAACLAGLVCGAAGFAACGEHEHSFSTDWSNDATSHWHDCTGDDCSEKGSLGNHTYGEWAVISAATEQKAGEEQRECTVCDYKESREIAKLTPAEPVKHEHKWGDWTVTDENKPTLTEEGKATRTCEGEGTCDAEADDKEYTLPELTDEKYTVTDDSSTCSVQGTATYSYELGEETVTFTAVTPLKEHSWQQIGIDQPTIHDEGARHFKCENCTATKDVPIEVIPSETYSITVLDSEGNPVEGLNVVFKGTEYSAETNANGVAGVLAEKLSDNEEYIATVEGLPESWVYGKVKVSSDKLSSTLYLAESVASSLSETSAPDVTEGIHAVTVTASRDQETGNISVVDKYLKISAAEAGLYTVTILDDGAFGVLTVDNVGENISGFGTSASVVMEAGDRAYISLVTDDGIVEPGYKGYVVFKVEKADPPALGVSARPIRLTSGTESTAEVTSSEQKVYFRLNAGDYGKYAKLTFGEGVQVYWLGFTNDAESTGTLIDNEGVVKVSEFAHSYLYAVGTGSNVSVTAVPHYMDGMKEKPIEAKIDGTENDVEFSIEEGTHEVWFKIQSETAANYIVKPDNNLAVFEVYNSVNANYVKRSGTGSSVVLMLKANTPVYLRATHTNLVNFKFTCALVTDADNGSGKDTPIVVTSGGDFTLNSAADAEGKTTYFKYTAVNDGLVTLTHKATSEMPVHYMYLWIFDNADYEVGADGTTGLIFNSGKKTIARRTGSYTYQLMAEAGKTYYFYIQMTNLTISTDPKLNITIGEYTNHSYELNIMYPNEAGVEGLTVKLLDGDETVATGVTDSVGRVTFNEIYSGKDYTVELKGIPAGYGHYENEVSIPKNYDEKTVYNLTLTELLEYSVTVKLPDGAPVEGAAVRLQCHGMPTFEGVTDEKGEYKVLGLPSNTNNEYYAYVTIPEEHLATYYNPASVAVEKEDPAVVFTLAEYITTTINIVDGEGNKVGGVTVYLGELSGTSNGEGVVTINKVDPVTSYELRAEGAGYVGSKWNKDSILGKTVGVVVGTSEHTLTVLYVGDNGLTVTGGGITSAGEPKKGENTVFCAQAKNYVKLTADTESETVTYKLTVECGVTDIYLNGNTSIFAGMSGGFKNGGGDIITVEEWKLGTMVMGTFTVKLNKGDVIAFALNASTNTITKVTVEEVAQAEAE